MNEKPICKNCEGIIIATSEEQADMTEKTELCSDCRAEIYNQEYEDED